MSFPSISRASVFPQQTYLPIPSPHIYALPSITLSLSSGSRLLKEKGGVQVARKSDDLNTVVLNGCSRPAASVLKGELWLEMPVPGLRPGLQNQSETLGVGPACCVWSPPGALRWQAFFTDLTTTTQNQKIFKSWLPPLNGGGKIREAKTKQLSFFQILL